jgi:CRP-like cAMP-binding protein
MAAALLIDNTKWPNEKCVGLLRGTELFGKFQYAALRTLLTASRLVSLKKSIRLFAENDAALSGFVLAEGVLGYDPGAASEEPTYLRPPAIIGKTALIVGCLRPATVIAETDAVLIEIPRATFLRVIAEYPDSAAQTRRLMFGHLRRLTGELDAAGLRIDAIVADSQLESAVSRALRIDGDAPTPSPRVRGEEWGEGLAEYSPAFGQSPGPSS